MIAPAALAGPRTQNFAEVINPFRASNSLPELPTPATETARRAQSTVTRNKGATVRHVQMILAMLPKEG